MNTFANLETFLTSKLNLIGNAYVQLFADQMVFLIQLGAPILILYYGYSIMSGRGSNATVSEMMWNLVRIGMIFAFMQNTGHLLDLSIGFIHELKGGFVGAESILALLDQQVESTKKLAEDLYALDVNYIPLKGFFAGLMLWCGTIFTIVTMAIVFISSEVLLVLLLTTAPIFIGCLSYGFLKEMFNGWLRSIFSCMTALIFATLVVRLGMNINSQLIKAFSDSLTQNTLMEVGALSLAIGMIVGFLTIKSTGLAGNIAGVAASAAIQGGMTAAAAGAARFGGVAGGRATVQGGRNLKSNISASVANRARLAESVQKAAIERVKQNNLK